MLYNFMGTANIAILPAWKTIRCALRSNFCSMANGNKQTIWSVNAIETTSQSFDIKCKMGNPSSQVDALSRIKFLGHTSVVLHENNPE